MSLNADQGLGPEPIEVEVTRIMANRMEHRRLLAEKVLETSQDDVFCLAGFTYSQVIAEKAIAAKGKKTFNEMIPIHYRDFAKVFSRKNLIDLPKHQPWDHAIDLEPDAVTHWKVKTYPMSVIEQEALDKFLEENLAKGYLRPSKSPMASPYSLSKRKTEVCNSSRIIGVLIKSLLRTDIHYRSPQILSIGLQEHNTLLSLTFDGGITTFESVKETNGKQQ
jgi:hypothetical protein